MLQNTKQKKSIQTNSSPYDTVLHRPLKEPIKILQNTHRESCFTEEFLLTIARHHFYLILNVKYLRALCTILVQF